MGMYCAAVSRAWKTCRPEDCRHKSPVVLDCKAEETDKIFFDDEIPDFGLRVREGTLSDRRQPAKTNRRRRRRAIRLEEIGPAGAFVSQEGRGPDIVSAMGKS